MAPKNPVITTFCTIACQVFGMRFGNREDPDVRHIEFLHPHEILFDDQVPPGLMFWRTLRTPPDIRTSDRLHDVG